MSTNIKTWQERFTNQYPNFPAEKVELSNRVYWLGLEIADLRAALAKYEAQMLRMATCAGEFARDACKVQAPSAPVDVCAEMRAICSACGGTGDVHSIDGEWRGSCDCQASAPVAPPVTPKHIEDIKDLLIWPVTEDDARAALDMIQSVHFDLSVERDGAPLAKNEQGLLPCPFCGSSKVKLAKHHGEGRGVAHQGDTVYSIDCMSCSASAANRYGEEVIISAWNRRAALPVKAEPSVTPQMVRELAGMVDDAEDVSAGLTAIRQRLNFLAETAAIPEGWQLVPKVITDDMVVEFCETWYGQHRAFDDPEMQDAYAAMLGAAPTPLTTGEA